MNKIVDAVMKLFSKTVEVDKQAAMAEILEWMEPRINEYYAPFIAEAVLHQKLKAAGITFGEFHDFVEARSND